MVNDKNTNFDSGDDSEDEVTSSSGAQRARNRTVMLTPDITGEVRARLAQDLQSGGSTGGVDPALDTPAPFGRGGTSDAPFGQGVPAEPADSGYSQFGGAGEQEPRSAFSQPASVPTPSYTPPQSIPAGSAQESASTVRSGDRIVWVKKGPVVGFLVSFDRDENGEVFPLRTGRLIVTSEAASAGNFLIVVDSTVSPMHAILRTTSSGEIQVLDQLSEHGTRIKRFDVEEEEELSGDKGSLEHGDVIFFGERKFHVCLLMREEEE